MSLPSASLRVDKRTGICVEEGRYQYGGISMVVICFANDIIEYYEEHQSYQMHHST